jgi:hypothetical protein
MAGRKRQPAKQSNKDDAGVTTGRPGSPRDDSQRAGHDDHGEPPAVPGLTPPSPPADDDQPPAGRQPQRPGQDARFVEQPGRREHVTGTTPPTAPKKR